MVSFARLKACSLCVVFRPNPANHQEAVQEVRLDHIWHKGGLALLVDHRYNVVTNVSFPLELCGERKGGEEVSRSCESPRRVTHRLTCCGSPSVNGSLVATWNMICLPLKEVKMASLPVWPWKTSSPPLNLRKVNERWPCGCPNFTLWMFCPFNKKKKHWFYPVKPCSWTVSPKIERNSWNSSVSSLLLRMSSSVSYEERS